jgi:hypothetical protein
MSVKEKSMTFQRMTKAVLVVSVVLAMGNAILVAAPTQEVASKQAKSVKAYVPETCAYRKVHPRLI